jgi:hypothetical protein
MHMRLTITRTQSHAMQSRNSKDSSERASILRFTFEFGRAALESATNSSL